MNITLDLPDELVIGAGIYAQTQKMSLDQIVEKQLLNVVDTQSRQYKIGDKIESFADCFGTMSNFRLDLDALRGRNTYAS